MTTDISNQNKNELQGNEFVATREELQAVDAAMAAIDAGEIATEAEIETAFARFRSA
jgi:predicted transcriptional regulator